MIREAHVNGIKLVYREEGGADALPLVLIHGRTADHNDWNGITQHFAARYHVLVPDLRGHGASDHPGDYPLPGMAEDVVALLDHLGIERATVIGHSLGGVVSSLLAASHPERVERLVLEDVPTLPLHDRATIVEDDSTGFDWRMMYDTERQFLDPDPGWAAGLAKITAPTLVLSGGAASPFEAGETAARIPGARLVTIKAGHLIHVAARGAFLRAVDAFLEEEPAVSPSHVADQDGGTAP
ncbi:alpha/beta fold hydrolase [Nonomuraea sp. K274]|uniref:Alpha/beta fold hydrolase n=1 Tax=Nonomuraea cypriaca TaxID=1187855 RepID=A0A931A776_9ACTN|nr:alpha/beta fold hydrolase [Nonomuraea cypriaca]MBF8187531.1 alpha/beta fold hydrolase [Nonomuraea cypriaca]